VLLDVEHADDGTSTVEIDAKWPIIMLGIRVPNGWQLEAGVSDSLRQNGRLVVLAKVPAGKTRLRFRR
jgi:hypothetical protein